MADVQIVPVTAAHVEDLLANMRAQDWAECAAYGRPDTRAAVRASIDRSTYANAALVDGRLACVFGLSVLDMLAGVGSPWMLGTPALERHARLLQRLAPRYVAAMRRVTPRLVNYVHARNATSIRWLRRLGFTLHAPVPFGAPGEMFRPFEMGA